jgi:solute carrier family 7 (cationic amino acid transporter), member 2
LSSKNFEENECFFNTLQLSAYTAVAICVILIRYEVANQDNIEDRREGFFNQLFNLTKMSFPTKLTTRIVTILVTVYTIFCIWISVVITLMADKLANSHSLAIILLTIPVAGASIALYALSTQPESEEISTFSVPLVPWIPALSIFINIYLLVQLGQKAWIRFAVGTAIGVLIYFFYSRRFSKIKEFHENEALIVNVEEVGF